MLMADRVSNMVYIYCVMRFHENEIQLIHDNKHIYNPRTAARPKSLRIWVIRQVELCDKQMM